jgi:hypothetical protein
VIPRYHGRWMIATPTTSMLDPERHGELVFSVTIRWNGERHQYIVLSSLDGSAKTIGRNQMRRWLLKHKAEPVDGQQPVA